MISTSDAPATAEALLAEARRRTDARLSSWAERLSVRVGGRDGAALGYALGSPGKRVRAALVIAAYRAAGGTSSAIDGVAAAVETVHTYSLVHDDLPCMDNDDLRRGRATTHRAFDLPTATRVGFLLVPVAAEVLCEAALTLGVAPGVLGGMAVELFQAGGVEGMVGGQWLDLEAEGRRLDLAELIAVHRGKTGALIRASCVLGGMAASAGPRELDALAAFGEEIGIAFQIADDVLDATSTSEALGKTAGRDEVLNKSTYAQVMGVARARSEALRLAARALSHLEGTACVSPSLAALANYIVTRSS